MKTILIVFFALAGILLTAVVFSLLLWCSWNWGVVRTVTGTHEIGFETAFWLSLFFSTVGSYFKTSVETK